MLVFFHRVLKKVPKETMTFELRPQRDGGASLRDTWGRGKCFRQKELSVQRSCGRREAGVLQERREASRLGPSDQEGRWEEVKPERPCRAKQSRAQRTAVRTG